ncbi:MAG TPA: hypothetical protein VK612_03365 [Pyrinomonadaceae bacterium]|nr:hypothetical protein [Pyrinomonadaceae bacterium]
MRQRALFILCGIIGLAGFMIGQARTVTNADLDKYKQQRLNAEKGLQDYYAKIGVTQAELQKREAEETKAREELSLRLRTQRLERERAEAELRASEMSAPQFNVFNPQAQNGYPGYIYYGNQWIPRHRFPNYRNNGVMWRATPMGVIYEPGSRPSSIWSYPRDQRPSRIRQAPR